MRPSRTASTASSAGNSADRSRDRGHQAPSTYPVVGAFGFSFKRSGCLGGSMADAADGVIMRSFGLEFMPELPSPADSSRTGSPSTGRRDLPRVNFSADLTLPPGGHDRLVSAQIRPRGYSPSGIIFGWAGLGADIY